MQNNLRATFLRKSQSVNVREGMRLYTAIAKTHERAIATIWLSVRGKGRPAARRNDFLISERCVDAPYPPCNAYGDNDEPSMSLLHYRRLGNIAFSEFRCHQINELCGLTRNKFTDAWAISVLEERLKDRWSIAGNGS